MKFRLGSRAELMEAIHEMEQVRDFSANFGVQCGHRPYVDAFAERREIAQCCEAEGW